MNLSASKYNSFSEEVWELSVKKISTVYLRACFCFVCLSLDLICFVLFCFVFHIFLIGHIKMIFFVIGHLHDGDFLLTTRNPFRFSLHV